MRDSIENYVILALGGIIMPSLVLISDKQPIPNKVAGITILVTVITIFVLKTINRWEEEAS